MKPLSGAIVRALRRLGLERDVAAAGALDAWIEASSAVLGPVASRTRAIGFDDRALLVHVPDAAWAGEIRLRETELVAALGRLAGGSGIERIRCIVGPDDRRSTEG